MIKNKIIIVTGAGSGIGYDTSITLSKRGHKVFATTFSQEQADSINKEFKASDLNIEAFKLDITKESDRKLLESIEHDVLICNAGIGESGSLAEIPMEKVRNNFEVNVFSTFEIAQVSLKQMIDRSDGTVIFMSSLAGRIGMPWLSPYNMTKFAITSGAEQLRKEMHMLSKNIHVTLIEPGGYHTGFNQVNYSKKFEWMKGGYFDKYLDKIRRADERQFNFVEAKSTKSIVRKIVKATEAKKPSLRYSAPWWQAWGIQILRTLGK